MKAADVRGLYEEIANSVTHGIGLGLSTGAVSALIYNIMDDADPWRLWSAVAYGASIILMFASSTAYHGVQIQPIKHALRIFDHCTIYLMIGGTMSPFILNHARDSVGLSMLAGVWALSLGGVVYKICFFGHSELISVISYFVIAALGVFGSIPMLDHVPLPGVLWLVGGLFVYTAGVYFYVNDDRPFYHTVWHLFVIAGVACHFVAISMYVIPT
jgi:hemolysin III